MKLHDLSLRDRDALSAMRDATKANPVLPKRYLFRRDAAHHLMKLGLASYRCFDGKSSGGYWLTAKGHSVLKNVLATDPLRNNPVVGFMSEAQAEGILAEIRDEKRRGVW